MAPHQIFIEDLYDEDTVAVQCAPCPRNSEGTSLAICGAQNMALTTIEASMEISIIEGYWQKREMYTPGCEVYAKDPERACSAAQFSQTNVPLRCEREELCPRDNSTDTVNNGRSDWSRCREGHVGVICGSCSDTWAISSDGIFCIECPGIVQRTDEERVLRMVTIIFLTSTVVFSIVLIFRTHKDFFDGDLYSARQQRKKRLKIAARRAVALSALSGRDSKDFEATEDHLAKSRQRIKKHLLRSLGSKEHKSFDRNTTIRMHDYKTATRKMKNLSRFRKAAKGKTFGRGIDARKSLHLTDKEHEKKGQDLGLIQKKAEAMAQTTALVKLWISYSQIVGQLKHSTGVEYGGKFSKIVEILDLVNLDFSRISSLLSPCDFKSSFRANFYIHITLLPVLTCALGLTYAGFALAKLCCKKRIRATRASARMNAGHIFSTMLFLTYPGLSVTIFRVFYCMDANGERFLHADLQMRCGSDSHQVLQMIASVCVVLYVVGIPILGAAMLYRKRNWILAEEDMHDEMHEAIRRDPELQAMFHEITVTYGALYLNYRHDAWYFEFVEMIRKAMLTGMLSATAKGLTRTSTGTLVAALFMAITGWLKPYRYYSNDILQRGFLLTIFITFFVALLIDARYIERFDLSATSDGTCKGAENPEKACRFEQYDDFLFVTHLLCSAIGASLIVTHLPPVQARMYVWLKPYIEAHRELVKESGLDFDGDGNVSIGEILSMDKATRQKLSKSFEKHRKIINEKHHRHHHHHHHKTATKETRKKTNKTATKETREKTLQFVAFVDPKTGQTYYKKVGSKETVWTLPEGGVVVDRKRKGRKSRSREQKFETEDPAASSKIETEDPTASQEIETEDPTASQKIETEDPTASPNISESPLFNRNPQELATEIEKDEEEDDGNWV
jgi:uncharacterized membrane protein YidH (DUF202 family)